MLYKKILNLTTIKKFLETPMLPIKNFESISQHFLIKNSTYKSGYHPGTDWSVPVGTPIFAPCNGYISRVFKNHPTMGNACYFIFKYQDKDYTMRVLHLSKVPILSTYLKGEIIAISGNTGKSDGPHVHIDLWKNKVVDTALLYTKQGVVNNLIDPYKFFKGIIE
jgi:murein DD-endopeptidase MepM/ murein hydrolase activator NlpD